MFIEIIIDIISRSSLIKILILGIKDGFIFFLDVYKGLLIFSLQD